jgi:hypothetical protein
MARVETKVVKTKRMMTRLTAFNSERLERVRVSRIRDGPSFSSVSLLAFSSRYSLETALLFPRLAFSALATARGTSCYVKAIATRILVDLWVVTSRHR